MLLTLSVGVSSCGDDDVDRGTHEQAPAIAAAGVYSGTWAEYDTDGKTLLRTEEGTVTVETVEGYLAKFTFNSPVITEVNSFTQGNITWVNNNGFRFANSVATASATNTLGAKLAGEIENNVLRCKFNKTVRDGRKTVTKFYEFSGVKN